MITNPVLRTLLCHRDVPLALRCINSAIKFSAEKFQLVIHDDGSLTLDDCAVLVDMFPEVRFISRPQSDEAMSDKLSNYPNALAFRNESVWGLKLLDIVLLEPGNCFYIDSDIAFFKPFKNLFSNHVVNGRCIFLNDTVWNAYSIRPWHLLDQRKLKVASGINTGLTLCDPRVFDLDFVDWFLGQPDWRVIPAWTEPTCWAALASRVNGQLINPKQILNLYPSAYISDKFVAGHFLSSYRSKWDYLLNDELYGIDIDPVSIEYTPALSLSPLGLAANLVKRRFQNRLGLM